MAGTPFVWDDLAQYKAEGRFLDGYPDDQRTFFAPRDNVHGLLVTRHLRKPGQTQYDPHSGRETTNQFESSVRFELVKVK